MTMRALGRALCALLAAAVLVCAFPPGTRLAAAAVAGAAAAFVLGVAAPGRGIAAIAFACCVSGSAAAAGGRWGLLPWPALGALSFASGAALRNAIRGTADEPSPLDRSVSALAIFWTAAAVAAAVSARTLWALFHGLAERAVNARIVTDSVAIRGTLIALAAVSAGLALYDAARRASAADRRLAVHAVAAGAAISGALAWLQSRGIVAASQSPFWKTVGRFSGLGSDPNAAGVLAALAIGPAAAAALHARRRWLWALCSLALAAGIAASGSRSGVLAALISVGAVFALETRGRSRWTRPALALFAVAVTGVLFFASRGRGGAVERIISLFDAGTPFAYRTSSRGLFWRCAWDAFRQAPLAGIGWNAFSWRLPDLAAALGVPTPVMDNPGNFYLEVLCETGLAGALLFAVFLRRAGRSVAGAVGGDFAARGAAAALIGFAPALAVGSHLLAAEVSIAAFLTLALAAGDRREGPGPPARQRLAFRAPALIGGAVVAAAALGWTLLLAPTATADEAFRHSAMIGFYPPELGAHGPFRWMRPRSALRLGPGSRTTLAFRYPDPAHAATLAVRSADRPLFSGPVSANPAVLTFVGVPARDSIFLLRASPSFRPSDSGAPDSRLLSLRVTSAP
ncbi:MAG TPA: O-antigen ligase family protein [Thermoanaerobaculia bacterium]|nr:O-antigen ligase family protein [Thermoanaerobaculia bacterium]